MGMGMRLRNRYHKILPLSTEIPRKRRRYPSWSAEAPVWCKSDVLLFSPFLSKPWGEGDSIEDYAHIEMVMR
jgi:hypothetical protein